MKTICKMGATTAAALLGLWLYVKPAWTQQAPPPLPVQVGAPAQQNQGIEVLNQGPIHEAYAEPITGQPQPGPIVTKQPPDPIDEMPPDEKPEGSNVQWIPGYWQWDDVSADFVWVSGFWRDEPPDKEWVPGFWNQVQGGWQWVPGYWADAQQQEVTYLPPPPPSIDSGPSVPASNPNDIYVPGVWVYRETRYFWRPGFFIAYNPDWVYVPAHYTWCPAGYVFIEGFWDFPLHRRGLLFAPVVFNATLLARPNWTYTPQYVVPTTTLVTALFVRPAYHSYYFGDYFGTAYQQRGFVPWIDYRVGRYSADPLFAHFSVHHRGDERYLTSLRELYAERQAGRAPHLPRTLAEVNRQTVNVQGAPTASLSLVTPLRDVNRQGVKLQRVSKEQVAQEHNLARQVAAVRTARQQAEVRAAQSGAITRPTERPRTTKWEVPRVTRPAPQTPARVQRPELPRQPQHVERPLPQHQPLAPERATHEPIPPRRPAEVRPAPRPGETPQRPPNVTRPPVRPGETPQPPREAKPLPKEPRPGVPPKEPPRPAPKQEKPPANKEPPKGAAQEARPVPKENRPAVATPPRPQPGPGRPQPQPQTPVIHEARPPAPQHAAPPPPRETRPQPPQHPAPPAPPHPTPPAHEVRPSQHAVPPAPPHPAPPAVRPQPPPPHPAPSPRPEPPHDKEKR